MILIYLFSFLSLKLILEITSFDSAIYQVMLPAKFSTNLSAGLTVIVQIRIIPLLLPLKIIPLAKSHSRKILSNNKLSTGFGDKLYSLYYVVS